MVFAEGTITFREFAVKEPLPLSAIQDAILEFLQGRNDAVLYGTQAVNAYVDEPRMTQDVDILTERAAELAAELKGYLYERFRISVRIDQAKKGVAFRLYQVRKPKNRHLADIRRVDELPPSRRLSKVLVMAPVVLLASKVVALHERRGRPKSGTDWRDLAMLLLAFPELKKHPGPVSDCLDALGANDATIETWGGIVAQKLTADDEDDGY